MTKIDGVTFRNMVDYAVRNLNNNCSTVNRLNVFPVPDGDTGTNMVVTIHRGLMAVSKQLLDLPSISRSFAKSVVYEARGNSGVIVSQFLKGLSERLSGEDEVEVPVFIEGLEAGVKCAYSAVATPVEGTMLTVLREATEAVKRQYYPGQSFQAVLSVLVEYAKISLENTPELLPVLKENGVVDSGGAGIVYLFEGMLKYLNGDDIEDSPGEADDAPVVDYDSFGRDSTFPYGYCTELLLQLLNGREEFDSEAFRASLSEKGDSLVVSVQDDKVRVHIHTKTPEEIFSFCHRYGEFLSVKVENMTVQHSEEAPKILAAPSRDDGNFAVVAVASDHDVQKLFIEMGADVAICDEAGVSIKDYIDAFEHTNKEHILVFPNSSDAILTAVQARNLYKKAKVSVLGSRSIAECYASLPTIDFGCEDIEMVADRITAVISNTYVVSISKRRESVTHDGQKIYRSEYYSFDRKQFLGVGKSLEDLVVKTVQSTVEKYGKEVITLFYGQSISPEKIQSVIDAVCISGVLAEIFTVPVNSLSSELTISFE